MGKRVELPELPKCAAIYARVSSEEQAKGDKVSIPTQVAGMREKAAELGLPVDDAHVYVETFSGEELYERPVWNRLRDASLRGEFCTVLVWSVDRLARDPILQGVAYMELQRAGCAVVFAGENIEDTPEGAMIRMMRGYAAKWENAARRERSLRAKREKARRGVPLMGNRPKYGYSWNGDKTGQVFNETTAPIMRRLFAEGLTGKTLRWMAADLTAEGVATPTGRSKAWDPAVIRNLLADPAYWGEHASFRTKGVKVSPRLRPLYKHSTRRVWSDPEEQVPIPTTAIPPLVSKELAMQVAERLRLNKELAPRRLRNPEDSLLHGGFARCGFCGTALAANRRPAKKREDGSVPVFYVCRNTLRYKGGCQCSPIVSRKLDGAVWAKVRLVLQNPEIIQREVDQMGREDDPGAHAVATIDAKVRELDNQLAALSRVARLTADDEDAAAQIAEDMKKIGEEKRGYLKRRENARTAYASWQDSRNGLTNLLAWCHRVGANVDTATHAERRNILHTLGVTVRLWRPDHTPHHVELEMRLPLSGRVEFGTDEDGADTLSVVLVTGKIQKFIMRQQAVDEPGLQGAAGVRTA